MNNFEQPQRDKTLTSESAEIGGEKYILEHKPQGLPPSIGDCEFVNKQWSIPRGETRSNVSEEMQKRELERAIDEKGEIVAICSYVIYKEGSPRSLYGDGHVTLTLVKDENRTRGIGRIVTKKAIDRIIENAKRRSDFAPPVVVQAVAFTEGGLKLMRKVESEYGNDVGFVVDSERLLF